MTLVDEKDLEITFYRASGPGGQKKNKTESAVRILHRPTGILVTASESRSQLTNRQKALQRLEERLAARNRRTKKRIATRPGKAARQRRVNDKKKRAETKQGRRKVDHD